MDTIDEILACLRAWEPDVRFVGNVLTGEAIEAIERLVSELAEAQEKALRFDLDSAGIERREKEATELVTLRAKLAECRAKHMNELLVLTETAKAERELRAKLAEFKKSMRDAAQTARLLGLGFSSVDRRQALAAELYMRLNALAAKEE